MYGTVSTVSGSRGGARSDPTKARADRLVVQGRRVFRFNTFGDQAVWGGVLGLHKAIEGSRHGGVGPGVSPKLALALGLKVDARAIPKKIARAIKAGKVNLDDPGVTLKLLKLNAVVGVRGFFDRSGSLRSVGITCAVCHSTVDNSFAPGIGKRLDGWPNQDLNVGAIVATAPNLKPLEDALHANEATVKKVLLSWGPGIFDAELDLDGKAFRPDGKSAATRIPSAFGKDGQNLHTWEGGWGTVTYWNAFVANLEMHGLGNFYDPRLDDPRRFPIAARRASDTRTRTSAKACCRCRARAPGCRTRRPKHCGRFTSTSLRCPSRGHPREASTLLRPPAGRRSSSASVGAGTATSAPSAPSPVTTPTGPRKSAPTPSRRTVAPTAAT